MSIAKMNHLSLIGLKEERDALLADLCDIGCVEISEPDPEAVNEQLGDILRRDTSKASLYKAELAEINSAILTLRKYAKIKKGLFVKREDASRRKFFDETLRDRATGIAGTINGLSKDIASTFSDENKLTGVLASLKPWESLDLPLECEGTKFTDIILGAAPASCDTAALISAAEQGSPCAQILPVSRDKEQQYMVLITYRADTEEVLKVLRPLSFGVVKFKDVSGSAKENIARVEKQLENAAKTREELISEIVSYKDEINSLQFAYDHVNQQIIRDTVAERFLTDGTVFAVEGWVPADRTEDFEKVIGRFTCAHELRAPEETEIPPTLLRNPKWMQGINMVTEMYSLPDYKGIDPNPLMFFWYVFFFGFMFADVAYGIIIFCLALFVTVKFKPKKTMGQMFRLGIWLGGATAICGVFVGGFFGNFPEILFEDLLGREMPAWLVTFSNGIIVNPVNDPMTVLIISLCIGAVHLVFGQCIHLYMGFRDKKPLGPILDVVPWWLFFASIAGIVFGGGIWMLIASLVILVLTQGHESPKLMGKLIGGFKGVYNITSWLSDILSYARLMALMLATSVIAQVFNTLGALPGNIIVFILIFLIGHTFNIGINLIGTYVHAARLQYLEFFGKFYIEGGVPFKPLQYDTKYVDIISEEEK